MNRQGRCGAGSLLPWRLHRAGKGQMTQRVSDQGPREGAGRATAAGRVGWLLETRQGTVLQPPGAGPKGRAGASGGVGSGQPAPSHSGRDVTEPREPGRDRRAGGWGRVGLRPQRTEVVNVCVTVCSGRSCSSLGVWTAELGGQPAALGGGGRGGAGWGTRGGCEAELKTDHGWWREGPKSCKLGQPLKRSQGRAPLKIRTVGASVGPTGAPFPRPWGRRAVPGDPCVITAVRGVDAPGISWAETTGDPKHPTVPRTVPCQGPPGLTWPRC